ncbi:hypothetical protein FBZ94_11041 [Bradyrhizobium sacchari]|uniref:Uncharacterized protein n=1 Tax=Bradyrhizobium sacchari TaxID=1399419 RepID=A0A560JEI5_9BRAD|nr:hypothetical protein FBZ94_11041 [Bradyrhizobium sacchari]TWB69445.1 hypothetical protein FBZ95_10941 [Bradyrhizobium sacchari]
MANCRANRQAEMSAGEFLFKSCHRREVLLFGILLVGRARLNRRLTYSIKYLTVGFLSTNISTLKAAIEGVGLDRIVFGDCAPAARRWPCTRVSGLLHHCSLPFQRGPKGRSMRIRLYSIWISTQPCRLPNKVSKKSPFAHSRPQIEMRPIPCFPFQDSQPRHGNEASEANCSKASTPKAIWSRIKGECPASRGDCSSISPVPYCPTGRSHIAGSSMRRSRARRAQVGSSLAQSTRSTPQTQAAAKGTALPTQTRRWSLITPQFARSAHRNRRLSGWRLSSVSGCADDCLAARCRQPE